jgi:hypothetical protein
MLISFHPQGESSFVAKLLIVKEKYLFSGLELTDSGRTYA